MSYVRELANGKDLMDFLDLVTALRGFVPEIRVMIRGDDGMLRNVRVTYVWPSGEFARLELAPGEIAKPVRREDSNG